MPFQKTKSSDPDTPGVGGVARSKMKSPELIQPIRICPNCGSTSGDPAMPGNGFSEFKGR